MDTSSYDWLITSRSNQDFGFINEVLNVTPVRFDQNIIVAYTFSKYAHEREPLGLCDANFFYENNHYFNSKRRRNDYHNPMQSVHSNQWKYKTNYETNYYRTSDRFRNLTRHKTYERNNNIIQLYNSGVTTYNYSRKFDMINISRFSINYRLKKLGLLRNNNSTFGIIISVIQYFKVRKNSTLYANYLGKYLDFILILRY